MGHARGARSERAARGAFGTTRYQYLLDEPLAEAARLLQQPGLDIAEIALRAGFSSQSHLTTAFRKRFGRTPARFRHEKRWPRALD